jgi:parvulin-like peptidyl-prolyl isomerase
MAEIYSEDASASGGGDLGWFGSGRMVKAFDSAVFAMEIGEISPPVRTQFGWHLINLLDIKTEEEIPRGKSEPEMVEKRRAAHILLKTSPSDGTLDMIVENATYLADSAKTMGLKEAAELFNYEVTTTMAFVEDGYISRDLSRNEEANKFAFSHNAGAVAEPLETSDAVYVIAVDSRLPESYTDYEDAQGSIGRILISEKAKETASDTARVIYDAIMAGAAPGQAAEKYGFEYLRSQMINRNSALPGLGSDPNVIGGAFALLELNEVSQPIEHSKGYAIITLLDRQSPDLTEFNELRDSVYMSVMIEKQQDVYNRWFEIMVQNTEIESRIDKFFTGS